jgi:hypothetical protein
MVTCSVKNAQITLFTFIIVVLLSACSGKKIQPFQTNQRDIAAVYSQKDTAEIYTHPYSTQDLKDEDFFAIQSKSEYKPLKRQLKNPIKVYFSNQQATDRLNN